jgi:crotonobetainyl-CoA:carnitine CoA-transferase CaiB-like acyl-CoA transferase
VDCCFAPILSLEEAQQDPQFQERQMFVKTQHPTEGEVLQFAFPIKFSAFACEVERHAPLLGEHSAEIVAQLGYASDEIEQLQTERILKTAG